MTSSQRTDAFGAVTIPVAAGAERVSSHLVDVLATRYARDFAREAARLKARAKLAPDDREAHDAAHEPPAAVVTLAEVQKVAKLASFQEKLKKRPTPREPGVFKLTTESLAGRANAAAVDALYHDWPDQCASDGLRFMAKDDLSAWMDVVFKKNAAKKDRERGTTSRPWGPTPLEWQRDRDVPSGYPLALEDKHQRRRSPRSRERVAQRRRIAADASPSAALKT